MQCFGFAIIAVIVIFALISKAARNTSYKLERKPSPKDPLD